MSETPKRLLLISTSTIPPGGFRYIQPETGKLVMASNWRAMLENVTNHRRANGLPIGTDLEAEIQDWLCKRLPDVGMHCYEQGRMPVRTYAGSGSVGTGYQGQAKWRELHNYALTERPTHLERVAWLANFAASLPCGECRRSWKQLVKQDPLPQDASDTDFFAKTVTWHNAVNAKLGKRILTLPEARAIYV